MQLGWPATSLENWVLRSGMGFDSSALRHLKDKQMNEFSWLPISVLKQVPYFPKLIFEDIKEAAGYYLSPHKEHPRGLISISSYFADQMYSSTLAHEFRHHWQVFNFGLNSRRLDWYNIYSKYEYERAICLYFNANPDERDALLFEYKYAKCDVNEYWVKDILKWKGA
jgi:hypothetical protein